MMSGRSRILVSILVPLSGLCFSACWWSRTPETPQIHFMAAQPASTLGPGDVFEVKVYEEPDLSGMYRVSAAGTINYPLLGEIKVEGMTSNTLADRLQQLLGEKYLKNPQVSIFVKEYNSKKISVFGQVNKPGTFAYEEGMTVIEAVSMAGGFTKTAAKDDTSVTRLVDGEEKKFLVPVEAIAQGKARNFVLKPGDIVYVPESIW